MNKHCISFDMKEFLFYWMFVNYWTGVKDGFLDMPLDSTASGRFYMVYINALDIGHLLYAKKLSIHISDSIMPNNFLPDPIVHFIFFYNNKKGGKTNRMK